MTSASWALQQAVFATLSVAEAVRDCVCERVYDAVPRGADFPYIVIGEAEETDGGTATDEASGHTLSVHVWSRGGGHREAKEIAEAVREALDKAELPLDGHTLVDLRFVSADFSRQSDGETFRALMRFKAITEPQ
jgi:hypothetical protein